MPSLNIDNSIISIVPKLSSYTKTDGVFSLNINSKIIIDKTNCDENICNEIKQNTAEYLAKILRSSTGFDMEIEIQDCNERFSSGNIIFSLLEPVEKESDEYYNLNIKEDCIKIAAYKAVGLFRAVQTLRQLFSAEIENKNLVQDKNWVINCAEIIDSPVYSYRGLMLDIARHFFSKEAILRQIDHAALYKINKLHLHLTDDQGWRIEIKSRPLLTEIGSLSAINGDHGGFLTQEDFIQIVEYAQKQYIEVIPEIDMPGHVHAAMASIPELNPDGIAATPRTDVKVGLSQFMCRSEATYEFIEDVLREISEISPSKYLHIGGDEADVTTLSDYEYFLDRAVAIVRKYGKIPIGWNPYDCTKAVNGDAVVQNWFVPEDSLYFPKAKKLKVILSPAGAYLDQKHNKKASFGYKWRGYINLKKAYSWYPSVIAAQIDVLGTESTLWSETFATEENMDLMLYPRLLANAEVGWTKEENRVYSDFLERLPKQLERLEILGVNYCREYD